MFVLCLQTVAVHCKDGGFWVCIDFSSETKMRLSSVRKSTYFVWYPCTQYLGIANMQVKYKGFILEVHWIISYFNDLLALLITKWMLRWGEKLVIMNSLSLIDWTWNLSLKLSFNLWNNQFSMIETGKINSPWNGCWVGALRNKGLRKCLLKFGTSLYRNIKSFLESMRYKIQLVPWNGSASVLVCLFVCFETLECDPCFCF